MGRLLKLMTYGKVERVGWDTQGEYFIVRWEGPGPVPGAHTRIERRYTGADIEHLEHGTWYDLEDAMIMYLNEMVGQGLLPRKLSGEEEEEEREGYPPTPGEEEEEERDNEPAPAAAIVEIRRHNGTFVTGFMAKAERRTTHELVFNEDILLRNGDKLILTWRE